MTDDASVNTAMSPAEKSQSSVLIRRLMANIDAVLKPLISPGRPLALVDFPNHPNVGDSAIWLGEAAWLAGNRNNRHYVCGWRDYDARTLRRRLPSGPVLIHGGGNFGDLWPAHQAFRERVIREFPDREIIQFPQTIHFSDPVRLRDAAAIVNAHPNFTLLARDARSLQLCREVFRCRSFLCPDMAFYLGALEPAASRTGHKGTVFLMRTDKEALSTAIRHASDAPTTVDWLNDTFACRLLAYAFRIASSTSHRNLAFLSSTLADRVARLRLTRGIRVLTRQQRVVTDRLHGHILCLLLGVPHQLVDNSYGKLSSFVTTWEDEDGQWLGLD
jgi:pyruvyl transferase EpsO